MTPADRRRWATTTVARLAAGRPVHRYGSTAWNTCGDANLRFCGLIVAAEAWAHDGDDLPAALTMQAAAPEADDGEWTLTDAALAELPALHAAMLGDPKPLAALDEAVTFLYYTGPHDWDAVARQAVDAAARAIDGGWRG